MLASRLNLIQRPLEPSIKENLLTEECSCSSKTDEKQINRKTHLWVMSSDDLSKRYFRNSNELVTINHHQNDMDRFCNKQSELLKLLCVKMSVNCKIPLESTERGIR